MGNILGRETVRKTLTATGAGLALAGAGVVAVTTQFATSPAVPASPVAARAAAPDAAAVGARTAAPSQPPITGAGTARAAKTADTANTAGTAKPAKPARHAGWHRAAAETWGTVKMIVARQSSPRATRAPLPARDRLTPVAKSGQQSWIPISPGQYHNAKAIVRQDLRMHMGLRSAVIAVATAIQESKLLNVNYGTSNSLGLFQQQPSSGWGSPAQVMRPTYAAHAFLRALRTYQANDPGWAHQPLWQAAQGVQASAYPTAYAQWESQAAHLVASITPSLV